jgi:serine/threonine protein kinase
VRRYAFPIEATMLRINAAFFIESPPPNPQTPINLRSPELLFLHHVSPAQDIWAFGCLVYSLLTNQPLFNLFDMGSREYLDDDHIIQMIAALGPLPASLKRVWPRYGKYFDKNDVQMVFELDWAPSLGSGADEKTENDHHVEEDGSAIPNDEWEEQDSERLLDPPSIRDTPIQDLYPTLIEVYTFNNSEFDPSGDADTLDMAPPTQPTQPPLRERWLRDHRRLDMRPEEADAVASLLEQILRYEPSERPSTAELLRHPWIEGFCAEAR